MVLSPVPAHQETQPTFSIDAQLLWNILIYERAGRPGAAADQSMFSGATTSEPADETNDLAIDAVEFDLVGSAGISGHKAVFKETPAYAPGEGKIPPQRGPGSLPSRDREAPVMRSPAQGGYVDSIGGVTDQDNSFLQVDDFGRAIENWFNFDL